MDIADLLKSHGDDEPSGENLEYDPAFISLELAAQPGEERQIGDTIIAAEEADHVEVIAQAMDVLGRSHDLRAAVILAHSMLRTKGFPGFAEVTGYIRGVLEQYWDTCHPQLDADDDDDPTMRVNAVASLTGLETIQKAIRMAPLTDSRTFGKMTFRDILIAEGELPPPPGMDDPPVLSQISAAFQDSNGEKVAAARAGAAKALEDVIAIEGILDDKVPSAAPDMSELTALLKQVLSRFSNAGFGEVEDAGASDDGGGGDSGDGGRGAARGGGGFGAAAGGGGSGAINTQQDVKNMLDRIIAYYARSEPSSPVPILLERAKRMVGMNFLDIIKDMAPDGLSNVHLVGGITESEEDE
ncbi:MAG: type VI secretion system protein TssA [Gemmobacter sp.]